MRATPLWNLDDHLTTTRLAFVALKDMIQHSRAALISERKRAEKQALKNAKSMRIVSAEKMTREDIRAQAIFSAYTPVVAKYGGYLPRLTNYSCVIQLYALFEDRGAALCDELQRRDKKIPLRLHELGAPSLQAIRTYLSKLCGVEFKLWHEIELLSQLRHRIVHHNGHTSDDKFIQRIKKIKGLDIFDPRLEHVWDKDSIDLMPDPNFVEKEGEKAKPFVLVHNEYVDKIVTTVSGLFDQVFKEKKFGDESPFIQHPLTSAIAIEGKGMKYKVTVYYPD
jgi:hypothetical protein